MARYGREDERSRHEYEPGRREPRDREVWRSGSERREEDEGWRDHWDEGSREDEWRGRWQRERGAPGWSGGGPKAEGGMPYGRGLFARAYALYAGRPEGEPGRREGREGGRGHEMRRGRPPKAYRRSDARILDEIAERLVFGGVDTADVEIKVENGEVTLTGVVAERRDKRLIEDACEDVFGVEDVHNQIRVSRRELEDEAGRGVH